MWQRARASEVARGGEGWRGIARGGEGWRGMARGGEGWRGVAGRSRCTHQWWSIFMMHRSHTEQWWARWGFKPLQREHIASLFPCSSFESSEFGWYSSGTAPGSVIIVRQCDAMARKEMSRKEHLMRW